MEQAALAKRIGSYVPLPIAALFVLNLVMVALHFAVPDLPQWAARGEVRGYLFDLGAERNVPSWYTGMQLGLTGVLLLGFATTRPGGRLSVPTLSVAGLFFLFLSLDELASLHEKLGRFLDEIGADRTELGLGATGIWMLVAVPAFLAVLAAAAFAGRELLRGQRRAQILFAAGVVVYAGSFAGLELLANWDTASEWSVAAAEELGEMMGATLLLWASFELVRAHGVRVFARP